MITLQISTSMNKVKAVNSGVISNYSLEEVSFTSKFKNKKKSGCISNLINRKDELLERSILYVKSIIN